MGVSESPTPTTKLYAIRRMGGLYLQRYASNLRDWSWTPRILEARLFDDPSQARANLAILRSLLTLVPSLEVVEFDLVGPREVEPMGCG